MSVSKGFSSREAGVETSEGRRKSGSGQTRASLVVIFVVGFPLGASCVVVATVATGVVIFSLTVSEAILTGSQRLASALLTGSMLVVGVNGPGDDLVGGC